MHLKSNWLYHSPLIRLRQRINATHTYTIYTHRHPHTLVINGYLWATIINDMSVNQYIKTLNLQIF